MSEGNTKIVLASASLRRAELLRSIGLEFTVQPVYVDETPLPGESPREHATRLAIEKACGFPGKSPDIVVIGCDTVVVLGKIILGKPRDEIEAREMLTLLSGKTHTVVSAVAMNGNEVVSDCCETKVTFSRLDDAMIDWYIATGEPMDKAGSYGIQGYAGLFVKEIKGSYSNVVGLPLHLIPALFDRLGIDFLSLLSTKQ